MLTDTVDAAYASSAPVQASVNMSIYWEQVYRGMVKYGKQKCVHNIKSAIDYIDSQLADNKTAADIKQLFFGRTAEKNTNEDFSDTLSLPLYDWQGNGVSDRIFEFCQVLASDEKNSSTTAPASGKELANRWANWPGFMELAMPQSNATIDDPTLIWCEGPIKGPGVPNCKRLVL